MVHQAVEERRHDHHVAEEARPVVDWPIARDDSRGFLHSCDAPIRRSVNLDSSRTALARRILCVR